jgi:hypothetical protein
MPSVAHIEPGSHRGRVCASKSSGVSKVAGIDCHRRAPDSACGKTPEVGAEVTPEAADMTRPKPAAGSARDLTPEPATHVAATAASSLSSSPRCRVVHRRSGQGSRNGEDHDFAQQGPLRASSQRRIAARRSCPSWCAAKDGEFGSVEANRCPGSLWARPLTHPRQQPRELPRRCRCEYSWESPFARATIPPQ